MSTEIRLRRGIAAQWTSVNPILGPGEAGYETDTRKLKIGDGTTAWSSLPYFVGNLPGGSLNDLGDVTITDAANGDFLRWNGTAWINDAVNLGSDTVGNYVVDIAAGTGVTVSHTPGEASTASIAIGQAVGTSSSVTFAAVTAPLVGNADTASTLQNARTISLSGDVSGSVSFNGSANVDITTTVQPNSVALGTDTTGNYVNDVVAGTGVTVTHTPGEGSSASIAIGQAVGTSASVQFAQVNTTGDITVGGNLTVNGTTTTLNTETLAVEDNIVLLNSNVTGSPSTNAGIEIERGDSANVVLRWNESTDSWEVTENGSDYKNIVTGDYVGRLNVGTGITRLYDGSTPTSGTEGPWYNISIGQDVGTSSSVTFAAVTASTFTGNLVGNADTASQLATSQVIAISGDVAGSVSFNGSGSVDISTAIQPNSVALGTDTTGNYMTDVVAGTGVTVSHTAGEGSTASISIGQAVSTSSSVTFAAVTAPLIGNANTASQLATARTISLAGDLSGSVSFDGSANVTLTGTVVNSGVSLNEISDVIIEVPAEFQSLAYDGTNWVNSYAPTVTYVRNAEATTLTTGTVVYLFGATGDHASVKRADNDSDTTSSKTVGLVATSIASGENGPVVTRGYVDGIDLSAYTAGDILWLAEDGGFTATKPSAPEHLVFIGVVVRATENGIIYVATQNGYELEELHDVKITSPQNNDFLKYNSASSIWVNDPINLGTDTTGNYMADVVAGTNISITHTPGEGSSASVAVVGNPTFSGTASAADFRSSTFMVQPNGYVGWLSPSDYYGRIYWSPTETRTVNMPDASGTVALSSASTGVIALGTDTTGNYMTDIAAGTGVTVTHTPGEGSTASIAIGQDVATSSSVTFAAITGPLVGNANTASQLATARTISLSGDASGSVSFSGSADVTIPVTVAVNSVALGTDTTGDYVSSLVAGTGITLTNNSGENATPTVSIGQAVATSSSVTFAHVTASAVTILNTPSNSTDAVTKQYVDQVAAGIDWHESVTLTTAAALPNTPTYDNGSSGSGATLTASANARLVIDGANATTGTRVLVKDQTNAVHNGVYDVTEQGSVSAPWVLTRAEDFDGDTGHEIYGGEAVFTTGGTNNIRQGFTVTSAGSGTAGAHEFGTDNVAFTQFTGTAAFTAGNGLTQSGNSIDVATASSNRIVVNADSIDLATVAQTNTSGTAGTSFVQSHTVDSYGRITGTVTADVQDASTSDKGIARFNSGQFSVSSGSVSIANNGITLGTHTTGDYISSLVAGTGVTLANNSGESATPTVSIGQAVATTSSVTFAAVTAPLVGDVTGNLTGSVSGNVAGNLTGSVSGNVTGNLTGNVTGNVSGSAATAAALATARTISLTGDVTGSVSFDGSANAAIAATIAANSVALGTDTTGNYVATITGTTNQVDVSGSGSENAAITLSLPQSIATSSSPTFGGISVSGTASVGSSASINGQLNAASVTIRLKGTTNQSLIGFNANTSSSADVFKIVNNYDMGSVAYNTVMLMRDATDMSTMSGILLRQTASAAGIDIGPRVLIDDKSMLDTPSTMLESAAASVVLYVDRHTSGSVGFVLKDAMSSSTNMFEWRDSAGTVYGSIGGNSASYLFTSTAASISSASISTASISTASVSGNLTVGGNLTVNGTTTTVNSTTVTVDDPIFTLGGDTAPGSDDNKDRGIEFRYHSGTAASVGFFGYDDSTGRFTFLTGATNTSEVFSGTNASVQVGSLHVDQGVGSIGVTIDALSSAATIKTNYSASIYAVLDTYMGGPSLKLNNNFGEGTISIAGGTNNFSFSTPIASASLSSASINAPVLSGSVHYNSSASVTLPAKTFFPEEYLTVSSSVTLNSTTHRYATLEMTATTGTSVITVPADASDNFPVGSVIQIIRVGAGEVQVTASAGVTVNNALGSRLRAQWATATLRKRAANTWLLSGDLKV